jgi:hypothetical protein
MNILERLDGARSLLMNLDLSVDQEAALDALLADAGREIAHLQSKLDIERRVPLGRYAFYHRHLMTTFIRQHDRDLHRHAFEHANLQIDRDGGKSFKDVVARLEQTLREISALITPATAYVETAKLVHQLIGSALGADGYAAHTHLAPLLYAEIHRALTLIEADEVRCETTLEYRQILRALLADDEQGELFDSRNDA